MHEWALAEAVISAASQIAEKEGMREIKEVTVRVGELQQIELALLEFSLSQLKTGKFGRTKFIIVTTKAKLKCRICSHEWPFKKDQFAEKAAEAIHFIPEIAHTYLKCPKCGSPDFEIMQGRGVWLERLKGVQ